MLRRSWRLVLAFAFAAACGNSLPEAGDDPQLPRDDGSADGGSETAPQNGDDAASDGAVDAGADVKPCTPDLPYSEPEPLENFEQLGAVSSVRLERSSNGALAFVSADLGSGSFFDILEVPFPLPPSTVPVNMRSTQSEEEHPAPLADDRKVYWDEPIDAGVLRIFSATRAMAGQKLESPTMEDIPAGGGTSVMQPWTVAGKDVLYFTVRTGSTTTNIWRAARNATNGTWASDAQITGAFEKTHPVVSDDELVMFLARSETGTRDVFHATRASTSEPWSIPLPMPGNVNLDAKDDEPSWLSPDRCTLIFTSNRGGASRAYKIVFSHL